MTWLTVSAGSAALVLLGAAAGMWRGRGGATRSAPGQSGPRTAGPSRLLFAFMAQALSIRALDAALRLARADGATVVAVYLAEVSLDLPLDAPIPRQCAGALALQEVIEQRAARFGVPVELRIERGRSDRHGLRRATARERFDRIVVAAATSDQPGLQPDDVSWLLGHADGEIVVLRPAAGALPREAGAARRTGSRRQTADDAAGQSAPVSAAATR